MSTHVDFPFLVCPFFMIKKYVTKFVKKDIKPLIFLFVVYDEVVPLELKKKKTLRWSQIDF